MFFIVSLAKLTFLYSLIYEALVLRGGGGEFLFQSKTLSFFILRDLCKCIEQSQTEAGIELEFSFNLNVRGHFPCNLSTLYPLWPSFVANAREKLPNGDES